MINESNIPYMLPNGQVYCESTIQEFTTADEVFDPKTKEYFSLYDVKKVYIL